MAIEQGPDNSARFNSALELHQKYLDDSKLLNTDAWGKYIKMYERQKTKTEEGKDQPNFGSFALKIDNKIDSYADLALERGNWANIETYKGEDERVKCWASRKITKYFQKYCIKPWVGKAIETSHEIFHTVICGKGISFHPKRTGCYPEAINTWDVVPDSKAKMDVRSFNSLFIRREYTANDLFEIASDEETAEALGWNATELKKLIKDLASDKIKEAYGDNLDLYVSRGIGVDGDKIIKLIHCYIKEYKSKKYSFYVIPEKERTNDKTKFLAKKENFFDSLTEVISVCNFKLTKTYWKTPSYAEDIFVLSKFMENSTGKIIRGAVRNAAIYLESTDSNQQKALAKLESKEIQVLPPGVTISQALTNNRLDSLVGVMRDVEFRNDKHTESSLPTGSQNSKGRAITAKEADIQSSNAASKSNTGFRVYAEYESAKLREIYRRFVNPEIMIEGEEGYDGHVMFVRKMKELGISKEQYAFENVLVTSNIDYAAGNKISQMQNIQGIQQGVMLYKAASTHGEREVARRTIEVLGGASNTSCYIDDDDERVVDFVLIQKVGIENELLDDPYVNPANVRVIPDDKHLEEIDLHVADMMFKLQIAARIIDGIESGQMTENDKSIALDRVNFILSAQDNKGAHVEAHMKSVANVPTAKKTLERVQLQLNQLRQKENELEQAYNGLKQKEVKELQDSGGLTEKDRREATISKMKIENQKALNDMAIEKEVGKQQFAETRMMKSLEKQVTDNQLSLANHQLALAKVMAELEKLTLELAKNEKDNREEKSTKSVN